jgi:prepilin-type N-terminal cleavage/methylation domain-containing protein
MTYKLKQQGFTIVELLIVIVVIGILAALVITTFTGIQQKARDTERTTDIKALHGQIEAFYASKGFYPSLADMNNTSSATWRTDNMKGLDQEALKDPKGTGYTLVATQTANAYAYTVTNAAGTSCEADDTTCAKYTLTSTNEGTPATFSKSSLN